MKEAVMRAPNNPNDRAEKPRILISGASIAGPTLAYWLARYAFQATVIERAPALRMGGNGVDIRGLATEVVKRMGIWSQIQAAAVDINGMSFVNSRNVSVSRMNMKALQRRIESDEVEILRGDLASILYDVTKHDVEYVFGDSIESLEQDAEGVTVTFENGSPRRFDLVIGADGIHSNVRQLAFGPESQFLRYKGYYFAFANADPSLGEQGWISLYNVPGKVAGVYRASNQTGAKAYFAFQQSQPLSYDYKDLEQQKRLLLEAFADVGGRVPELLAAATADPNFYFDTLSQVVMPSWSSGRVAVVGDAAYCASPVTGAGASLSLVGAYRLAGELSAANGNHQLGFSRYENGYRKPVERSQSQLFTGLLVPSSRIGIWARNTLTRLPIMGALAGMERMLTPPKSEQLPDYKISVSGKKNKNVLISGASIAGLTLAYWLRRHKFDVTVAEIAAGPRMGGSPIDVRGPALAVADRMGILPKIRAAKVSSEGMAFVDATGKTVGTMDTSAFDENGSGDIELRRDYLVDILYDAAKDGVEYRFEDTIQTLVQDDDGVSVTFASGETRTFDLVVGADGLHSVVRRLALGDESRFVRYLGMYVALAEVGSGFGGRANWVTFYNSPGKIAGIARYPDQDYAMFVFRSPLLRYDYHDVNQKKKLLIEAFANQSSWQVPSLLDAATAADDLYFDSVSQVRMPSWTQGRVALIGDAAHCAAFLSGMGSSLAMVGASVLADELAAAAGDYQRAFKRYEEVLRPIVEPIQSRVPQAAQLFVPATNFGIWLRNALTRLSPILLAIRSLRPQCSSAGLA
jgi:2-polyprenyl-6-methoxyphenol hydroxylase-like FAD-dependent oxidoreductase